MFVRHLQFDVDRPDLGGSCQVRTPLRAVVCRNQGHEETPVVHNKKNKISKRIECINIFTHP